MELSIHNRRLFLGCLLAVEVGESELIVKSSQLQEDNVAHCDDVLQVVGVIACILTIHWAEHYKGGVVWGLTDLGIAFNWHPVLMTVGLIFLYGNGELLTIFLNS